MFKRPARLKKGDLVAVLAPSWGGPSVFPYVYQRGVDRLKKWGLRIKEYDSIKSEAGWLRNHPEARARDINQAFGDDEIKAIFTAIGGDDSIRILPYLDKQTIRNNPKALMGYSDTTSLHVFLNQLGLVSFYGPSMMAGFSQMESLGTEFESHLKKMLFEPEQNYVYQTYRQYCDGYPDWSNKDNLGKINELKNNDGWHWLQGQGRVEGELFGGCFEVLEMMKATAFWPEPDFWQDKIFFLETSEEKPSLHQIDHGLRNYGMQGVFEKINGLLLGRARDYSDKEKKELEKKVIEVVVKEFNRFDLVVVTNMDFGHTDPQLVLPLGIRAKLDATKKQFSLKQAWLS